MSSTRDNTPRGFTLIELLVVIAIIAILAAVLFPVFAAAREKARAISCLSNEKQMGLGFMQYVQDNDETFPRWQYDVSGTDDTTQRQWPTAIYPYIKNGDHSVDPANGIPITLGTSGVFMCPDYPLPNNGTPYAVNLGMMQEGPDSLVPPNKMLPSATLAQLPAPADTALVIEVGVNDGGGVYYTFDPQEGYWTTTVGSPPGSHPDDIALSGSNAANDAAGVGGDCDATAAEIAANNFTYGHCGMMPRYRHSGTTNVIFSDGHAKAMVRGRLNWYTNIYIQGLYEKTPSNGTVY